MVQINTTPWQVRDAEIRIDGDEWDRGSHGVTIAPEVATTVWPGLTRAQRVVDSTVTGWSVTISALQDWDASDSLVRTMLARAGEVATLQVRPRRGSGPTIEIDVVIAPGVIGGERGDWARTPLTLAASGEPIVIDPDEESV
jgi:hypothetical protein